MYYMCDICVCVYVCIVCVCVCVCAEGAHASTFYSENTANHGLFEGYGMSIIVKDNYLLL